MRLLNIHGKLVYKSVGKKRIKWNKKSRSKLQTTAKNFLAGIWKKHIVFEEFPVYGTRMSVDFLNATKKIAIEVNGRQHSEYVKFFHGSRLNYFNSIKRDVKKAEWLEMNGFTLIEIDREDVEQLSVEYIEKEFNVTLI
jgi:very-short-patch-repair endonuclease|tara:strand:+ start:148 stop:564 length:417 start_codon:yes stop_codon:yes gene_type:complete